IETIEVLKGPASILFGSLEPGGVINLVTEQPTSEPFYRFSLRSGNRTLIEPSLDLSGPLTEDGRLLYRLNALHRTEDSFRGFDDDDERFFIAPVVRWRISDRTDLTLSFEYLDSNGASDVGLVALGDGIANIPFDRVLGDPEDTFQVDIVRVGYDFEHRFSDHWTFRNAFRFNSFDVESSQFVGTFLDETTGDLRRSLLSSNQDQDHFEFQTNLVGAFNTGAIEHRLLFGVDLFRRENPRFDTFAIFSPEIINIFDPVYGTVPRPDPATAPTFVDQDTQIDALGVYIQDQINLLDHLILLAGIRYETVEQEVISNPTIFSPMRSETRQNNEAFSPRVGLVYQPIEAVSLYSSYSTSFVPNSETTFDGDLLDPERGEQFEIGIRTELLDGRLMTNLAFFDLTKRNVATPDPNNFGSSIATGEQRSRGIELDVAGEMLPGWNIIANYAFTDADVTQDNSGLEGNRLFGVPEHNFNLWTTYDIQDGPLVGLGFGLGFNYVSERFGDNANSFMLDSYFLTNAAISYEHDNWRAALNIRNLFDVDYIEGSQNSRLSFISPGEGFTLIGSFSIEF
ncbi:MAG: TonB-dependent siderophore receptor, partial [Cyanobacteria bacterium J06659_2]